MRYSRKNVLKKDENKKGDESENGQGDVDQRQTVNETRCPVFVHYGVCGETKKTDGTERHDRSCGKEKSVGERHAPILQK